MRVVLCTIAKHENIYLNEWIHYYLDLGFSHIYIFDNNEENYSNIKDFIDKDIQNNITVFDYHKSTNKYLNCMQVKVFQKFYDEYMDTFDWCAFFDPDEYLVGIKNINTFLADKRFNKTQQIKVKWKLFGDNNVISRDVKESVHDFFKRSEPVLKPKNNITKFNTWFNACKCLIAGHQKGIKFSNVHFATNNDKELFSKYPSGQVCSYPNASCTVGDEYKEETVFLNHYVTKTLSEFLKYKYLKSNVLSIQEVKTDLDYFWAFNDKTKEKEDYVKEMLWNN